MIKDDHVMDTQEHVATRNLRGSEPGMPVFDKDGVLLGTVVRAYDAADAILERIASALEYANVPSVVVARIRQDGCLEVYGGLRRDNYYVLPDQIAEAANNGVFLNCSRVALVHL
jgi:hypothetical protein